jgi:hypothetical protein
MLGTAAPVTLAQRGPIHRVPAPPALCQAAGMPAKVPRRVLGSTGLQVSVLGFGASPLGSVFEVRWSGGPAGQRGGGRRDAEQPGSLSMRAATPLVAPRAAPSAAAKRFWCLRGWQLRSAPAAQRYAAKSSPAGGGALRWEPLRSSSGPTPVRGGRVPPPRPRPPLSPAVLPCYRILMRRTASPQSTRPSASASTSSTPPPFTEQPNQRRWGSRRTTGLPPGLSHRAARRAWRAGSKGASSRPSRAARAAAALRRSLCVRACGQPFCERAFGPRRLLTCCGATSSRRCWARL